MRQTSALDGLTPQDLDLPEKFEEFRRTQVEGVDFALGRTPGQSFRRFTALGQPTGSGKSLGGMALGKITGQKFVILTATRNLETQLSDDFTESGLVNIRGRQNYECVGHSLEEPGNGGGEGELDADSQNEESAVAGNEGGCGIDCDRGYLEGCRFSGDARCTYRAQGYYFWSLCSVSSE